MLVRFEENVQVRHLFVWRYAHRAARRGNWEQCARDRERFKLKIKYFYEDIINPVLESKIKQITSNNIV